MLSYLSIVAIYRNHLSVLLSPLCNKQLSSEDRGVDVQADLRAGNGSLAASYLGPDLPTSAYLCT